MKQKDKATENPGGKKMLYKTSPISSTNQCHFEKEGEEGL